MRIRSCVLLAFLWGAIHSLVADILYSVTDLGNAAHAYGINNAGQLTGYADTSSGASHAFLYSNGQMTDLGTLGGSDSMGNGINNVGLVTGVSSTSFGGHHAATVRWRI